MSVLILAPATDGHAIRVSDHLRTLGHEVSVLDVAAFPQQAQMALSYTCCGDRGFRLKLPGGNLVLDDVRAAWWRRPRAPEISDEVKEPRHRAFAMNECLEAVNGLWHALDAFWINDPVRDQVAHRKITQLRVASDVGLCTPDTLITNDPVEARVFVDRRGYRDVIFKAFSALEDQWRETRLLREEELTQLDNVRFAPVIFQEYIKARYDLRITVVGEQVFPAAIHASNTAYPVDCRMDIANAKIEPVTIPAEVEEKLRALMNRLGLVYGAIDMRLSEDGERYVFLEVNPAGQWLYIEEKTGQPIAETMAKTLAAHDVEP